MQTMITGHQNDRLSDYHYNCKFHVRRFRLAEEMALRAPSIQYQFLSVIVPRRSGSHKIMINNM